MQPKRVFTLKFVLLVVAIVALVSAPFVIWGDTYVLPLLESHVDRTSLLIAIAIMFAFPGIATWLPRMLYS